MAAYGDSNASFGRNDRCEIITTGQEHIGLNGKMINPAEWELLLKFRANL